MGTKMALEQTFIMVKPDGVSRGLISEVINRFEKRAYKLVAMKFTQVSEDFAKKHYADLSDKPFFSGLVKFTSGGPVVAMVWEGKEAIKQGRAMMGETDPTKSAPGTIRGDYCIDTARNLVHGSDSAESAKKEIELWFPNKQDKLLVVTLLSTRNSTKLIWTSIYQ